MLMQIHIFFHSIYYSPKNN